MRPLKLPQDLLVVLALFAVPASYAAHGASAVPELKAPTQISGKYDHTCAIDEGTVKCWGHDGVRRSNRIEGRTQVPATIKGARQVSAGHRHSCALDQEGVKCWGDNE